MFISLRGCYMKPDQSVWRDCKKCNQSKEVNDGFGWRNPSKAGKIIVQSYCVACRTAGKVRYPKKGIYKFKGEYDKEYEVFLCKNNFVYYMTNGLPKSVSIQDWNKSFAPHIKSVKPQLDKREKV